MLSSTAQPMLISPPASVSIPMLMLQPNWSEEVEDIDIDDILMQKVM